MSSKRGYLNVDPDYEDVSEQQNKKQRLIEKDAKAETIQKIEKIIQKQITIEIKEKENELNIIDQSIYQTRHLLDRLRACLVANYYSNDSIGNLPQKPYSSAVPSIHPAVKKYLGKKPSYSNEQWLEKSQWQGTSDSSTGLQSTNSSGNCSQSSVTVVETGDELGQKKSDSLTKLEPEVSSGRASRFRVKKKLIVGNISKFIPPDRREESDPSTHKWLIYVRGTKEEPNINHFVKKVWFFLHPSYRPNDLVEVVHPPFHLSRRGWGEFPVRVQLHFHDQRNKRVDIIHHLKLDRTYTGLQTFGAETTVEIEIEKGRPSENDSPVTTSTSSNVSCATKTQAPVAGTQSQDSGERTQDSRLNSNGVTSSSPSEIVSAVNPKVATEKENTTVSELKKELVLDSSNVKNGVLPSDTTKSPSKLKVYKLTVGSSSSTVNEVPLCLLPENSESFSLANSTSTPLITSAVSGSDAKVTCTAATPPIITTAAAAAMTITAASPVITKTATPETTIIASPAASLTTTTATSFTTITPAPAPVATITPVTLATTTTTTATNLTKPVISCNTTLPYFVTLTSLPSSKLPIPVAAVPVAVSKQKFAAVASTTTTTTASSTSIVGSTATTATITTAASVLPATAILAPKPANLQGAAPVPMKVQNLQNLPLNTLLKCLNNQGKVLLMSQPLVGKSTTCLPASALVSSQTNTASPVSATVTSLLHSNSSSVTTTTSSTKPPITISKPFLTNDAIKKVPNNIDVRSLDSSSGATKTYTIQLGSASNLPEVSGQNDSVLKDKANPKKENTPVISPFRVTSKGLISIPSSTVGVCWSSPVTVQSSLSQINKPNPVASHTLLSMGSLSQSNVLPTSLMSLSSKVPTTTNTSVILLSSSPVNKNTSLLAASSPVKKTITQPGIFIPTVTPGVVRPLVSEIKSTPGKSSLLLLSSTTSGLNKGPIVTGNKILQSSPSVMNSVSVSNTSGTTTPIQPFILSSSNSSISPAATRLPLMSQSTPVINVGMQNVKTLARSGEWRQPVRCNLVTSSSTLQTLPSTFSTGKQTYVLTTTRNKGLSLLPSHLFLKPNTETKPDACQSLLTKSSTSNMNTTQPVLSGIGSTPNTVATTSGSLLNTPRPMLLLKNPNKTAMIVTPVNNSTMPTGRIWPSASVAEKPANSNITSSQEGAGTNVSLQVQYSNGNLVLAPPSGFGNNSLSQKVLLKVIPSTSTCNPSSVSSLPKSSNGTVSLSTVTTTVSSTTFPKTTSVITKQVRPTVCEKKIHGYNKAKKIQPVNISVPSINFNALTDMMSVIRAVVRLHPLVSEGVDRSLHPYATDTVEQWLSWNIGKRRASEWQRASSVKNYILKLLSGSASTNFSAADVWSTKQIFSWCRLHAYTPHHLEKQLQQLQSSSKSFSEASCMLQPLSSFTPMETIEKRLEQLEDSGQSLCNENFLTVDVISRGLPKVKIKKEVDVDPVTSSEDYKYLPSPDASNFVHETARQVGVQFKPTKIEENIYSSSCELMIYSCMENIMSDILRTAFALKSEEGRYPTELSLQDIHKALTSIPACDFLTNSNLGLVVDSDHTQPSVDHNKEKHGIT
ncbi:YEATS domain-containing protein 2 [Octopus bimaculoides]|uniref:YEATS domain-containing protein 2 n=1 Tax=Octopus bimaculoides TaxID=37653 RepID=A0A0L8FID7_OCTBM|nr:YEATS domain-containing protein 2 [Octopus bimaculoides]|eukprot:XP_014789540.1 PREDICTED: YEATS domain-containing protein 2-like [Octopus bimaculoides]